MLFDTVNQFSKNRAIILLNSKKGYPPLNSSLSPTPNVLFVVSLLMKPSPLKILTWHFSRYRDYSNAIRLLKQIKQHPNTITTDGLPVYKQAIEELFSQRVHKRVHFGHNNAVE